MKKTNGRQEDKPSTVTQLAAALIALGKYSGENSEAEHAAEAKRLGSKDAYQMLLANALMGTVEIDAMFADSAGVSMEQMQAAHHQALASAGVEGDPGKLLHFLQWRTLRVAGPLREIAQNTETGPLPLAAAHAAEGLQRVLAVCAAGQKLESASPSTMTSDLKAAREALVNATANIDIMLQLVAQAEDLFSS